MGINDAVTGLDDLDDEDYDDDDPDDWDDRLYPYIPDEGDYEQEQAYEEYWEHRDAKHGGGECDCRPSLRDRLTRHVVSACGSVFGTWYRARAAARHPWTVRLGRVELTLRLNAHRQCGACTGRGWFYSKTGIDPMPMPPGYDGVSLCGCGTAIGKLAGSRRAVRQMRKGAPF